MPCLYVLEVLYRSLFLERADPACRGPAKGGKLLSSAFLIFSGPQRMTGLL